MCRVQKSRNPVVHKTSHVGVTNCKSFTNTKDLGTHPQTPNSMWNVSFDDMYIYTHSSVEVERILTRSPWGELVYSHGLCYRGQKSLSFEWVRSRDLLHGLKRNLTKKKKPSITRLPMLSAVSCKERRKSDGEKSLKARWRKKNMRCPNLHIVKV